MRKVIVTFFVFLYIDSFAQQYGVEWEVSYYTTILDFKTDTVKLDSIPGLIGMFLTNADICDADGNLLCFTNGCYVVDKKGNMLMNGDSISPCYYTNQEYTEGLDIPQATLFLPMPGNSRYSYLFHFSGDTLNRPDKIYYSLIDAEGNGGLGAVVKKNIPILTLTGSNILRGGGMTACKHANGRDYWIVMPGSNNNEFYKFLLTPDTVLGPFIQYIGPAFNTIYDLAYSKFSQDGSKYVTSCVVGYVLAMDFDRCSGEFSNPISLFNNDVENVDSPMISGCASEEFSPNGRFVYVSGVFCLNQYDLWANNIQDSSRVWTDNDTDFFQMNMLQVAPNGKIYTSTWNGGLKAYHVINYPDLKGDSCHFVFGGQPTLSANSVNVPNMINYNLGPLVGSGCDTITSISNPLIENSLLRIMPNPADKYLYVEMGMQGNYEFNLLNEDGQVIDRKQTRQVDDFDTEHLASGVYFLKVIDKGTGKGIETKKIVVQH